MVLSKVKLVGTVFAALILTLDLCLFVQEANASLDQPVPPKVEEPKEVSKKERAVLPEVKIEHVDRVDMGRLHVGAIAQADLSIRYIGPVKDRGLSVRIEPPPFATVSRSRIVRMKSNDNLVETSVEMTIDLDTASPGELVGEVQLQFQNRLVEIPVAASVLPQDANATRVLAVLAGFGGVGDPILTYRTWHKMLRADKIDVSYCGMLDYLNLPVESDPGGHLKLPDRLARYDVILIDSWGVHSLNPPEVKLLKLFVESGKRLIISASPGMPNSIPKANSLLEGYGLRLGGHLDLGKPHGSDIEAKTRLYNLVRQNEPIADPLTDRVKSLHFFQPTEIVVTDPKTAKILSRSGETGAMAVSRPGKGEIVVIGSQHVATWIELLGDGSDNLRCLRNLLTKPVTVGK